MQAERAVSAEHAAVAAGHFSSFPVLAPTALSDYRTSRHFSNHVSST